MTLMEMILEEAIDAAVEGFEKDLAEINALYERNAQAQKQIALTFIRQFNKED